LYPGTLLSFAATACAAATAVFIYVSLCIANNNKNQNPETSEDKDTGRRSTDAPEASSEAIIAHSHQIDSGGEVVKPLCTMGVAKAECSRWAELASLQESLLARLCALESKIISTSKVGELEGRQLQILERTAALEAQLGARESDTSTRREESGDMVSSGFGGEDVSEVQARLTRVMLADELKSFKFVRAPPEYYSQSLEFRMRIVGAASVNHLCKSIVMQNTRAPEDLTDCSDPFYSKYYMVFVQYTAKLHAEKLHTFVRSLAAKTGKSLSKKQVNMRLVPEEVNTALTGFEHNAVAPVGCAVKIPMIVSHRIASLQPEFFWLGGGEVDLKLGLSWSEFNDVYQPFVADCTYD